MGSAYRSTPRTCRVSVTLRFTTTTTVGMVDCPDMLAISSEECEYPFLFCFGTRTFVHGNTTDRGPDVEPSASTGLSKLAVMVMGITRNADGGAGILADLPDLTALKTHIDIFSSHDSDTIVSHLLLLAFHNGERTGTATKDGASLGMRPHVEDGSTDGDQMQR